MVNARRGRRNLALADEGVDLRHRHFRVATTRTSRTSLSDENPARLTSAALPSRSRVPSILYRLPRPSRQEHHLASLDGIDGAQHKEVDPGGDAPARIIPSVPDGAVQAGGMIGSHQSGNAVTQDVVYADLHRTGSGDGIGDDRGGVEGVRVVGRQRGSVDATVEEGDSRTAVSMLERLTSLGAVNLSNAGEPLLPIGLVVEANTSVGDGDTAGVDNRSPNKDRLGLRAGRHVNGDLA